MKLISVFLALVSLVSGHIIQADIRIHPEKYNLMTIDTSNLPEPVEAPTADDFVQLSEVNMHYRIYGEGGAPLILIHGNGGIRSQRRHATLRMTTLFMSQRAAATAKAATPA